MATARVLPCYGSCLRVCCQPASCAEPCAELRDTLKGGQNVHLSTKPCVFHEVKLPEVELHHLSSHYMLSTWVMLRVISTERRPRQTPGPRWSMAMAGAWSHGVGRAWTWVSVVLLVSTVLLSFAGTWPECCWQSRPCRWHGTSHGAACGAGAGPHAPAPNEKHCLK